MGMSPTSTLVLSLSLSLSLAVGLAAARPDVVGSSNSLQRHSTNSHSQPGDSSNICDSNITIGRAVVAGVNLTRPGLEAAAAAAAAGELGLACQNIADFYRSGNSTPWLRLPAVTPGTALVGGSIDEMVSSRWRAFMGSVRVSLRGAHQPCTTNHHHLHHHHHHVPPPPPPPPCTTIYTPPPRQVFNDTYSNFPSPTYPVRIPRTPSGGLEWTWWGPDNDDEFMNVLNRHSSFTECLGAWNATGNPVCKDVVTHPCNLCLNAALAHLFARLSHGAPSPAQTQGTLTRW